MDGKLGDRIKRLRQRDNLTQQELAKRLNVSSALISAYELGDRNPSLKNLFELSDIFQVSSDYLLGTNRSHLHDMENLSYEEIMAVQAFVDMLRIRRVEKKEIN